MSAIDDLTTVPDQPQISEGNKTFSQKTFALWLWIRTKLVPAMVELRDLIVNSITGAFSGTSTSTVTIVDTGEVSITTDAGRSFKPGTPVRLAYVTDPLNYIDGITKTYNASTGAIVFYALSKAGSGEYSNWSLTIIPSGGGLAGLGSNTFVGAQFVPDDPYDATGWNGSTAVPTKNAIRDALVALIAGLPGVKNATNDSTFSSTSADDVVSPEWLLGRVGSLRFKRTAWSSTYTPAAGELLQQAHGLSSVPYNVRLIRECVANNAGYVPGDRINAQLIYNGGSSYFEGSCFADATNVGIQAASGHLISIFHKSTGALTIPSASCWKYCFEFSY